MKTGDFREMLLLLDDPKYMEMIHLLDSCFANKEPFPPELTNWLTKDNLLVYLYHGLGSEWRESKLSLGETEGETQMRHFCVALNKGEQPTAETLDYFKKPFERIQNGENAKEALKITKKQGRKKTETQETLEVSATYAVENMRNAGSTWEEAVNATAEHYGKDFETIKGYHKTKNADTQRLIELGAAISIEQKIHFEGVTLHEAISAVAKKYGKDFETIEFYHAYYWETAQMLAKLHRAYVSLPD